MDIIIGYAFFKYLLIEKVGRRIRLNGSGHVFYSHVKQVFDQYKFHPLVVFESNNLKMITQAVQSGFGYAFVTPLIMEEFPELIGNCVDIDLPERVGCYGLSYNRLTMENRNARNFRDFILGFLDDLQERFADWEPTHQKG